MITPLFSISQTPKTLLLRIRAPHSRPKDIHLHADNNDFRFYTSPYLLHLNFEHPVELPPNPLTYDLDTGVANVTLDKQSPYPHFDRLDMLSTLLVTAPKNRAQPSIEVVKTTTTTKQADEQTAQRLETSTAAGLSVPLRELSIGRPTYGFGQRHEAVFASRAEDLSEVVELPMPDVTPVWRRASLRKAAEDAKFSADHYMADFLLEYEYEHVMQFDVVAPDITQPLADHYIDAMLKLPRREYLKDVDQGAAADLAGLLYAAMYDLRITLGECCVESAWTIARLCASMSFLQQFRTAREAVLAAYRRSLVYPLYRNVKLANRVLDDVKCLVCIESADELRARLLRVLLEVREIFEQDKLLRLHADLFLIDYCVWIQKVEDAVLKRLRDEVMDIVFARHELEWDLDSLERKAFRMANGEEQVVEGDNRNQKVETNMAEGSGVAGNGVPDSKITISALSSYPSPGLEMVPMATRVLKSKRELETEESIAETSSYEYTSNSSSGSSSSAVACTYD